MQTVLFVKCIILNGYKYINKITIYHIIQYITANISILNSTFWWINDQNNLTHETRLIYFHFLLGI